jgi:sterol desaturase/sphingolipid hydroxylase (fatty acid hydroxylase superfamily)
MSTLTKNKKYLVEGERSNQFNIVNFIKTSSIETFSFYLLTTNSNNISSISQELFYFIPRSFIFELIFDLGHYCTHRFVHSFPLIYRIVHKKHHGENDDYRIHINATYRHTIYDYLLTNTLPLLLAGYIVPSSKYFYNLMFWYKDFVEFSGHTGKYNKTGSFPQCKWLPEILSIELYSSDHNIHHTNSQYNFSKRFSIWDKLFNTYKK